MTTKIEWCAAPGYKPDVWNPLAAYDRETGKRGSFCTKVSLGCKNCYAEAINIRLGNGYRYTVGNLEKIRFQMVNLTRPLSWRTPRQVFVNSMTDLFHEEVSNEWIASVFVIMALADRHRFLILTKRAERLPVFMAWLRKWAASVENVSVVGQVLGLTVEQTMLAYRRLANRRAAPNVGSACRRRIRRWRISASRISSSTPAAMRFISAEPLLAPIDVSTYLDDEGFVDDQPTAALDWVIVGGESSLQARECHTRWIEQIITAGSLYEKPIFVKQLGRHAFDPARDAYLPLTDKKGGDWSEWPKRLRIRDFPRFSHSAAATL
jgi:protein gp37